MNTEGRGPTWSARAVTFGATALLAVVSLVGCGAATAHGIELGQLREQARRVEGGGVECPLSIGDSLIRPSTAAAEAPVLPERDASGNSSMGSIGSGLPTKDSVQITCSFATDGLQVDLAVLGVPKGHALGGFSRQLRSLVGEPGSTSFIDANAQLPVGEARAVPGGKPVAFVRVKTAAGDVGLLMWVGRQPGATAGASVPTVGSLVDQAERLAASLSH